MRKITLTMLACGFLILTACKKDKSPAKGTAYQLNAASKIEWTGKLADGTTNNGTINVEGIANSQGYDFDVVKDEIVSGEFKIPVSSIDVTNLPPHLKPILEEHLKTADFFYMLRYPNVVFKVKSGSPKVFSGVDANYLIKGEMTLIGQTQPFEFPAKVTIANNTLNIKADFAFDRTKWGMSYHVDPRHADADRILADIGVKFNLTAKVK